MTQTSRNPATRGAIGPLTVASGLHYGRDGLGQLPDRLPEPAAIHRKHPRMNGEHRECAGPNHSRGAETRNSGENGILPHSLVQRSFDGVRRMAVDVPNGGAVRQLC
jgi:hypothetical protein